MQFIFSKVIPSLLIGFFISSCSQIKPRNRYPGLNGETPTTTINKFKNETQRNHLDEVVVSGKLPQKQDVFFLKGKDKKTINKWVNYFSKSGKRGFETFLKNGEKYKPIIQNIFNKHNLPTDLYYVGLIESGYKNHAKSHAGAVGPWQFIKETARRYGLKVTRSIDERKNIYKSTQAAALYFQDLYNIFGSWELALAAYNAGEYGVIRRIRGANTRDFFELSKKKVLPRETRNYVPKVFAAMKVDKNRKAYRLKVKPNYDKSYISVRSYQLKKSISLNKLSKKLGVSKATIKKLNHDIAGSFIPYLGRSGFELYLPQGHMNTNKPNSIVSKNTQSRVVEVTKKRRVSKTKSFSSKSYNKRNKKIHKVRKNESLFSISKRYNVGLNTLKKINRLKGSTIYPGQKILLPSKDTTQIKYSYVVKKGDHLSRIAGMFKIGIKKLKNLNNMNKTRIYVGQKLKVPAHKKKFHTVKSGDALFRIASRYGTSIVSLRRYNNLKKGIIYPGQKIIVEMLKI
jgi:membrane-bound lytic murein transglycosylase D